MIKSPSLMIRTAGNNNGPSGSVHEKSGKPSGSLETEIPLISTDSCLVCKNEEIDGKIKSIEGSLSCGSSPIHKDCCDITIPPGMLLPCPHHTENKHQIENFRNSRDTNESRGGISKVKKSSTITENSAGPSSVKQRAVNPVMKKKKKKKKKKRLVTQGIRKFLSKNRVTRSKGSIIRFAYPNNSCQISEYSKKLPPLDKFLVIGDGLTVGPSGVEGAKNGLFATKIINKRQIFTWYQGKIVSSSIGLDRGDLRAQESKKASQYLCTIDNKSSIDGISIPVRGAGGASFVNHSAQPNVILVPRSDCDGVFLEAIKTIPPGQEILATYKPATLTRMGIPAKNSYNLKIAKPENKIGGSFECPVCEKKTGEELRTFRIHLSWHKIEQLPSCDVCGKEFVASYMPRHKLTHLNSKLFECVICNKSFNQQSNFINHKAIHVADRKTFNCLHCSKSFSTKNNCKRHTQTIHLENKSFSCRQCKESFTTIFNLKKHQSIHTKEKPYSGSICLKNSATVGGKNSHHRVHTKEKPYPCSHCQKSYSSSSNKKRHERIHTGEKPYTCSLCSEVFYNFAEKKVHGHTHKKPYPCKVCPQSFAYHSSRAKHIRCMHTGENLEKPPSVKQPYPALSEVPTEKPCSHLPYRQKPADAGASHNQ